MEDKEGRQWPTHVADSLQRQFEFTENNLHDERYKNVRGASKNTPTPNILPHRLSPPAVPATSRSYCVTNNFFLFFF